MLNSQPNHPPKEPFGSPTGQPASAMKQQLIAHANEQAKQMMDTATAVDEKSGMLLINDGNQWVNKAENEPDARMLFGEFWHEGELCILFADTNLGKSILAVQIGDSISRGVPIHPFRLDAAAQPVLYLDFELTKKQFQHRYKNAETKVSYRWSPQWLRAEIDPDNCLADSSFTFEEYLNLSLENAIQQRGIKILIIDNLTYLRNETEKAKDALPLMKYLKALKITYDLSILALAHTPKRNPANPITRNDLQGSKMLMNFCDSAFSIGESQQDNSMRYLKQIKQRNTQEIYGGDNVCLFQIVKPDTFLKYEFIDFGYEYQHLRQQDDQQRDALKVKVTECKKEGRSIRETAALLQISRNKVERLLKEAD